MKKTGGINSINISPWAMTHDGRASRRSLELVQSSSEFCLGKNFLFPLPAQIKLHPIRARRDLVHWFPELSWSNTCHQLVVDRTHLPPPRQVTHAFGETFHAAGTLAVASNLLHLASSLMYACMYVCKPIDHSYTGAYRRRRWRRRVTTLSPKIETCKLARQLLCNVDDKRIRTFQSSQLHTLCAHQPMQSDVISHRWIHKLKRVEREREAISI